MKITPAKGRGRSCLLVKSDCFPLQQPCYGVTKSNILSNEQTIPIIAHTHYHPGFPAPLSLPLRANDNAQDCTHSQCSSSSFPSDLCAPALVLVIGEVCRHACMIHANVSSHQLYTVVRLRC